MNSIPKAFSSQLLWNSLLPSSTNSDQLPGRSKLPKNIFNFTILYLNNSLPTRRNLLKWGISATSECSFCSAPESLLHVVAGCHSYRERFTWRHNSILSFLALPFQPLRNIVLFFDLPGFSNPSIITGDSLCPDLNIKTSSGSLNLLELTVRFKSNLENKFKRKNANYIHLVTELCNSFKNVEFINLSKNCSSFKMLDGLQVSKL